MDLQLAGKIALVTGASSGLGYATACQLLQEGAKVAVCSRSMKKLQQAYAFFIKNMPDNILLIETDLTSSLEIKRLIECIVAHYHGLDIVITNNGGPPLITFEETTEAIWQTAFSSLLMSCVNTIQYALPYLRRSQAASILTVTSVTAKQSMAGFLLSNVFRPAVMGLTKSLSKELGKFNIRVNSILPGFTTTERFQEALNYRAKTNCTELIEELAKLNTQIPLGRLSQPDEFAKTAVFLVSSAASNITGTMMLADGGFYNGY